MLQFDVFLFAVDICFNVFNYHCETLASLKQQTQKTVFGLRSHPLERCALFAQRNLSPLAKRATQFSNFLCVTSRSLRAGFSLSVRAQRDSLSQKTLFLLFWNYLRAQQWRGSRGSWTIIFAFPFPWWMSCNRTKSVFAMRQEIKESTLAKINVFAAHSSIWWLTFWSSSVVPN